MSAPDDAAPRTEAAVPSRGVVIAALGVTQILAWGSSYYLLAVLAEVIARDTGWSLAWIVGALSLGLLVEGLVSPYVGDSIERHGGRPVLGASAIFLAVGLTGLAVAPSLPFYVAAWLVIGAGMGAGLYDATFSTLGRLYGLEARRSITLLTLFGGFASTVCWPLTAYLAAEFGWRGACLTYASIQIAFALPAYWFLIPRENRRGAIGGLRKRSMRSDEPADTTLAALTAAAVLNLALVGGLWAAFRAMPAPSPRV